jgi:RimJ/RimL family protein N-acetyltransferase
VLFEIGSDPLACEMAGVKPRTREAFMTRWKEVLADPAINTRVIEIAATRVGGAGELEFAGSISVFQAPGEARDSIGYWLAREYWGRGIASRALAMFLHDEPRRPLHATAAMTNIASHRVLLKNGFRLVGTRMGEETDRYMAREIAEFVLEASI